MNGKVFVYRLVRSKCMQPWCNSFDKNCVELLCVNEEKFIETESIDQLSSESEVIIRQSVHRFATCFSFHVASAFVTIESFSVLAFTIQFE